MRRLMRLSIVLLECDFNTICYYLVINVYICVICVVYMVLNCVIVLFLSIRIHFHRIHIEILSLITGELRNGRISHNFPSIFQIRTIPKPQCQPLSQKPILNDINFRIPYISILSFLNL